MVQGNAEISLSVVAPAHNERENVAELVAEIETALEAAGFEFEIIIVDDGSTDGTGDLVQGLLAAHPRLRLVRMRDTPPGRGNGQSAAFHAGFHAAGGRWIASLDSDRQNDPADIPAMWHRLQETGADLVQGDRSRNRRDTPWRGFNSWVGRFFRRWILGDTIRDTGCSLRIMRSELARAIPLQFQGMHRFIPITARHLGFRVVEMNVNHRPRVAGQTNYGTWDRAWVGLSDCLSVRWMSRRRRPVGYDEVRRSASASVGPSPVGRRADG